MDEIHSALYGGVREPRTPILASIYKVIGGLTLAGAIIFAVLVLAGGAYSGERLGVIGGVAVAIPIAIAGILLALVAFGTAQVISFIGQTAHNTGAGRDDEIVDLLKRIEKHLAAASPPSTASAKE